MTVRIERSPEWKIVDGAKRVNKECPRCHNIVDFVLVHDQEGIGWEKTWFFVKTNTVYVLHCPICIYCEEVPKKLIKQLREKR